MAFIGNTPTNQSFTPQIDYFSGNGSTTAFTLSRSVASAYQIIVVVANVPQNPSTAFTVSGTTLTFTSAPPSGTNNIWVEYTSLITQYIAPSAGTVTTSTLSSGLVVPVSNGGTNQTNFTSGQIHYGAFSTSSNFTYDGTNFSVASGAVSDSIGNVRSIPLNSQTSAYVVAASDNGKMISITTGGVTVNNSIMSAGMVVTIYNNSGSSQTITQGAGVTLQWAGQTASTTGTRTLGLYGMATIIFLSASSAVITGSGLT